MSTASPPSLPLSCHTLHGGFAVPVAGPAPHGTSLGRGCPLCCGCFKGLGPICDLLHSNVARDTLNKTQPALNSAGTGSKEKGEPGERKRVSMWFSNNLSHFILQFKGKTHSGTPDSLGAVSVPRKCILCSCKHRRYYPFGYYQ